VFDWAEDVVGFEEAGEEEEREHDAGGPGEHLEGECGGQRGVRLGFGFAEDDSAEKGDGGGEGDEEEHLEKPVGKDLGWLEDGLGVFDGEEEGAKDRIEAEHAEEKSSQFGKFQQRALDDFAHGEFFAVRYAHTVQEQRAIRGDPHVLQAIPYVVGHCVLTYAAEQRGERSIGFRLPLDVLDHEFAVVAKKLFDEAGETLPCRCGLVEEPDVEDELPCFPRLFAGQVIALPEGPEEGVVFGSMLRRGLEGDPGPSQPVALVVGHDGDPLQRIVAKTS
jgi:hypothetical protein